jgi:hypothetical protein
MSAFDAIDKIPTSGRVWKLPAGSELGEGIGAVPGSGEYFIGPTNKMPLSDLQDLLGRLPWVGPGPKI